MRRKAHRILAVDDDPLILEVLQSFLSDYTLKTAASGTEALEMAPAFRPDIMLLDVMMPLINGITVCRQIRDNKSLSHTKIIMLSSNSQIDDRLAGYEAGADDFIIKPFNNHELLAKVQVYLKLKSIEEYEEVKNRTIEVLQHSNRTPLNNIISYAELLTSGYDLDPDVREEIPHTILKNARRLHKLLEKGEFLASMRSGQFSFEWRQGDLCNTIQSTAGGFQTRLSSAKLNLSLNLPPSGAAIFDQEQIQFALNAILDNAIRLSKPNSEISIALASCDGMWLVTVADQGPGISADLLPNVFDVFGNPQSPLFNHGDGLSLAIVQQIVWAHDGVIWAESTVGEGARFILQLPRLGPTGQSNP